MKTRKQYRKAALSSLEGNWTRAVLCTAVYFAVAMGLTSVSYFTPLMGPKAALIVLGWNALAALLLIAPLKNVGLDNAFKDFYRLSDVALTRNMFTYTFRGWFKGMLTVVLMMLIELVATMMLVVPGIILTFAYVFAPLILRDNPQMGPVQAMKSSRKMMKGHKMELFLLALSFIGWAFLCVLTAGIGLLWFIPWFETTMVAYYEDLKTSVQQPVGDIQSQD